MPADVGVYGATAGGVMAALAARRHGLRVVLLEPGRHIGGMTSGGIGRTDMDRQEAVIGGLAREFFERVGAHYRQQIAWRFEPSVAQKVLVGWLEEAGVDVRLGSDLATVHLSSNRIVSVQRSDGSSCEAEVWIDASYEGDLLARAGVSYAVGRDGGDRYGESLAGRREILPGPHQFRAAVDARGTAGGLLPNVQPYEETGRPGDGDGKLQAYSFRVCLTTDPSNRLPIPEPAGYERQRLELLSRYLRALGESATIRDVLGIADLPNGKADINSGGPVSTNLLGAGWGYPEADAERRATIRAEHLGWVQSLLFYLATDAEVPNSISSVIRRYGLPRDEFNDTEHWPHQLYIREARRMLGEHVLTQHDLQRERGKPDSIGMGGYNIDIREVQWVACPISRFPDLFDEVLTEGYLSVPVEPYEIPYRSLLPVESECANLLVSCCVSTSHVAFSSFRMEPQFMIAGHSAGVAAALALRQGVGVHDVDRARLQETLRREGQILSLPAR